MFSGLTLCCHGCSCVCAGRVLRHLGLPLALGILPAAAGLLMAGIALWPVPAAGVPPVPCRRLEPHPPPAADAPPPPIPPMLADGMPPLRAPLGQPLGPAVAGAEVLRKILSYSLARPARESLFTVVSREEKYKAKIFLDTVVQVGGGM